MSDLPSRTLMQIARCSFTLAQIIGSQRGRDRTMRGAAAEALVRERRAVLVVDLVESVRLMRSDEDGVIDRWRRFVTRARSDVLPRHAVRFVKSLGDGMLCLFDQPVAGAAAARDLAALIGASALAAGGRPAMQLRMGLHVAAVVVDDIDVYGSGVNLAARLASLGRGGDLVVSAEARSELVDGFDADLEDMGECFVKHIDEPLRVWRASLASGPTGSARWLVDGLPSLAVLPAFTSTASAHSEPALADALAQAVSACAGLRVLPRPSAAALGQRPDAGALLRAVGVPHVAWVECQRASARIRVHSTVDDCHLATFRIRIRAGDDLAGLAPELSRVAQRTAEALQRRAEPLEAEPPLPTMRSHALLLTAIAAMHRMTPKDSDAAGIMLDELAARHPRSADPPAWLAKWHMLRVAQRWTSDPERAVSQARFRVRQALDVEPDHSLASAIHGQMQLYEDDAHAEAERTLARVTARSPSEPMGWLFLSNVLAFGGRGPEAMACGEHALALSPFDLTRYLYKSFLAQAALAAHDWASALDHAGASLRANCLHLPSYPPHIIAAWLSGDAARARASVLRFRALLPQASVSSYVGRFRGPRADRDCFADALRASGLPP